jgi:hypothetical protein
MAEGERSQERAQSRRGVPAGEERVHTAVAQQGHVIDGIGTGDHSRDQRGDFRPWVGALVGGHREVMIGQSVEADCVGKGQDWEQAGGRHEVGIVEGR